MTSQRIKFFKLKPNSTTQLHMPLQWLDTDFRTHLGRFDEVDSSYKLNGRVVDVESQASFRVFGSIFGNQIDPLLRSCVDLRTLRAFVRRDESKHFPVSLLSLLGGRYTKTSNLN